MIDLPNICSVISGPRRPGALALGVNRVLQ